MRDEFAPCRLDRLDLRQCQERRGDRLQGALKRGQRLVEHDDPVIPIRFGREVRDQDRKRAHDRQRRFAGLVVGKGAHG